MNQDSDIKFHFGFAAFNAAATTVLDVLASHLEDYYQQGYSETEKANGEMPIATVILENSADVSKPLTESHLLQYLPDAAQFGDIRVVSMKNHSDWTYLIGPGDDLHAPFYLHSKALAKSLELPIFGFLSSEMDM